MGSLGHDPCMPIFNGEFYFHPRVCIKITTMSVYTTIRMKTIQLKLKEPKHQENTRTSLVETVLRSSGGLGTTVSTTITGLPEFRYSSATWPPSAAAAVSACSKLTAPTTVSRARSFSYVLTAGSEPPSESKTAWRMSCSLDRAEFGVEWTRVGKGYLVILRGSLERNLRFLEEKYRGGDGERE